MLLNEWSAIVVAPLLPYELNKFWRKKVWEEKSSTFSAIRTFFCSNFLPRPISESIRNFCSNLGTLVYILDPIISKKFVSKYACIFFSAGYDCFHCAFQQVDLAYFIMFFYLYSVWAATVAFITCLYDFSAV